MSHADKSASELQDTLKRYELIFSATNDVLYDVDLQTARVVWNQALYSQYGYSANEPAGTLEWWTGHIHPDDALLVENQFGELFDTLNDTWQHEYRFGRADGGYNYVRDRGVLLRDKNGKATRLIGSLLDVTQQKQFDRAKDEFISLVSHQLRTPLTVIRVYSEMLGSGMYGPLTKEQLASIQTITDSAGRLIQIVGDILNVSRAELDRINIVAVPRDINQLLTSYIAQVQPLADEKRIQVRFTAYPGLPQIPLDDAILSQVVHNLLTNAIRYSAPKSGQITLELKPNKGGYLLSVQDNGIGIPKSAQSHIFDRFYRAKNAVNIEVQGSGLGLYLVKIITDAFGGKIWFETTPKNGTTFYLQIPRVGMVSQQPPK